MLSVGGYPELPGMVLVDPVENQFDGQIVYLDFDGAANVTYDGPVVFEDLKIPAFEAPGELAGQEEKIIADIVAQLEETFAGTGSSLEGGFVFTKNGAFVVDVPNGTYDINVLLGDKGRYSHDQMGVILEGVLAGTVSTGRGQVVLLPPLPPHDDPGPGRRQRRRHVCPKRNDVPRNRR